MIRTFVLVAMLVAGLAAGALAQSQPRILSFDPSGEIQWDRGTNGGILVLETAPAPDATSWRPIWYDGFTNPTNGVILPALQDAAAFYRLTVRTAPPDPTLLMHLTFDNDMRSGVLLDVSGSGNHALRFGRRGSTTNWPGQVTSLDGSLAGNFNWYPDGWSVTKRSGDYGGITNIAPFMNLTNATVMAWAHFRATYTGGWLPDNNAAILSTGYAGTGAWELGRNGSDWVEFSIQYADDISAVSSIGWPDRTHQTNGDTGGWNWYAFTFEGGKVVSYFNNRILRTNAVPVAFMSVNKSWIGVGCKTHKGEPWLDSTDIYPNHGWLNGTLDDIRIYNRVLTPEEMRAAYNSFDRVAPTAPGTPRVQSVWSSGLQIDWPAAQDRFGVTAYRVYRDGGFVTTVPSPTYVETGLPAGSAHTYAVRAVDSNGNFSALSTELAVQLPNDGSGPTITVDDTQAEYVGVWTVSQNRPGYIGSGYRHDGRTDKGNKFAIFRPNLPEAGNYEVFAWYIASATDFDSNVPFVISAADRTETLRVSQRTNGLQWNSLGVFRFDQGTNGTVTIGTGGTTNSVIADAIRFVERP